MAVAQKKRSTYWSKTLRAIRNRLNLKQAEFAERLDVPVSSLRSWEYGHRVPGRLAQKHIKATFPEDFPEKPRR